MDEEDKKRIEFIEALIKDKGFDKLSDKELDEMIAETYKYGRYLRKSQDHFWDDGEDTPIGLLKEMDENEEEMEALTFEQERRNKKKEQNQSNAVLQTVALGGT